MGHQPGQNGTNTAMNQTKPPAATQMAPPANPSPTTTPAPANPAPPVRSEEHTSELQSRRDLVCRIALKRVLRIAIVIVRHDGPPSSIVALSTNQTPHRPVPLRPSNTASAVTTWRSSCHGTFAPRDHQECRVKFTCEARLARAGDFCRELGIVRAPESALVAQRIEHQTSNLRVGSSNLSERANKINNLVAFRKANLSKD